MRLTADVILRQPSYFNPLKERELDLRGLKIPQLENLGATQDQYDSIDLSDNEIARLENFPLLQRLKMLLLNNNKIAKITDNLFDSLPNLEALVLTNNKLVNLNDIDPLCASFNNTSAKLRILSLLDNMITKKQHYRLYVIHKLPGLRILDYKKIKQTERIASEKLFGPPASAIKRKPPKKSSKDKDHSTLQDAELKIPFNTAALDTMEEVQEKPVTTKPSKPALEPSQVAAIRSAIDKASSFAEIQQLETALATGQIPATVNTTTKNTNHSNKMES